MKMEKICVLGKLHSGLSYSAVGYELNVRSQYMLNMVSWNRNAHNKNVMTRGSWEPNLVFPLGAMVCYSLIKCSGSHHRIATVNNENWLDLIGLSEQGLIELLCVHIQHYAWHMGVRPSARRGWSGGEILDIFLSVWSWHLPKHHMV